MSAARQAPRRAEKSVLATHMDAPRLALRKAEAVAALGVSDETFDRYVRPTLPVVRCGTVRLYPVAGIAAWLEDNATAPLDELGRAA